MDLLIEKAKKGDVDSFMEIINIYELHLYKMAKQILKNDEDIGDAIQETIISAYKSIHALESSKYFKTWLFKILINKSNDIFRKNKNITFIENIKEIVEEYNYDEKLILKSFLDQLSNEERLIINLYYKEGFNFREIGEILNINENTVKSKAYRAKEKLRNLYNEEYWEGISNV